MPTICSADCGSGRREREGHGEQEILGTSVTCSAIGRSRIRKASAAWSTIRGTGKSRICTNGHLRQWCWPAPLGQRRSQNLAVQYFSCFSPGPGGCPLVPWKGVPEWAGQGSGGCPLRSEAGCGHFSAARAPQGCPAASGARRPTCVQSHADG